MRRLTSQELLESYDLPHDGRNRRYYRLTEPGRETLEELKQEWYTFKDTIDEIVDGNKVSGYSVDGGEHPAMMQE